MSGLGDFHICLSWISLIVGKKSYLLLMLFCFILFGFFLSFESCKYNDIAYILGRIDLSQG